LAGGESCLHGSELSEKKRGTWGHGEALNQKAYCGELLCLKGSHHSRGNRGGNGEDAGITGMEACLCRSPLCSRSCRENSRRETQRPQTIEKNLLSDCYAGTCSNDELIKGAESGRLMDRIALFPRDGGGLRELERTA